MASALVDKRLTSQPLIGEGNLADLAAGSTAHGLLGRDRRAALRPPRPARLRAEGRGGEQPFRQGLKALDRFGACKRLSGWSGTPLHGAETSHTTRGLAKSVITLVWTTVRV